MKQEDNDTKQPVMLSGTAKRSQSPVVVSQNELIGVKPIKSLRHVLKSQAAIFADQNDNNTKRRIKRKPAPEFDYAAAIKTAKEEAERAGVIEVPTSEVFRLFEDGSIACLYHSAKRAAPQKYFFAFDRFGVLACIPEMGVLNIVLQDLALLRNGSMGHSLNPADVELEHNYREMEGPLGSDGWAVRIQPKSRASSKRVRTS